MRGRQEFCWQKMFSLVQEVGFLRTGGKALPCFGNYEVLCNITDTGIARVNGPRALKGDKGSLRFSTVVP